MSSILFWGALIITASALLQGLSGFGFSIMALPLLSVFWSPKTIVPLLLIFSMILNLTVLYSSWRAFSFKRIWRLLAGGVLGLPLGTKLLIALDDVVLRKGIGLFVVIFSILLLSGKRWELKREKLAQPFIGFVSGIFSGSVGISGPPIILFLSNKGVDKDEFRASLSGYFFLINFFTIPYYLYSGLFTETVINLTLKFGAFLITGAVCGAILAKKINQAMFGKMVLVLLLLTGLLALLK